MLCNETYAIHFSTLLVLLCYENKFIMSNESKSTHLTESESSVLDSTQAHGIPVDDCHSSISYKEMEDNSTDVNVTDSLFTTITTTDVSSEPIVTKTMIDRKELQRDLDLAKIELTQRNLMIDSMKAQYLSQLEELEERVSDEMHEKQVLAVQFENRLRILKDGFMRENKRLQNEIQLLSDMLNKKGSSIMQQQGQSFEFKETFTNLEIDDSEYEVIKRKAIDDQSLWEFIAVSILVFGCIRLYLNKEMCLCVCVSFCIIVYVFVCIIVCVFVCIHVFYFIRNLAQGLVLKVS